MRILGKGKLGADLTKLGLNARDFESVDLALRTPHGLVLVTGPTGSGKTTTLYTMLNALNRPEVNIVTAEDPVEYQLPGITQVQIKTGIGLSFERALRAFLRQDPDIMLIGEIRDLETAEIAVKASITGHLVFSTLHTNSAPVTITRLAHMGMAPFLIAASVKLIIAQRLIKTLCVHCKTPADGLTPDDTRFLTEAEAAGLEKTWRAVGCAKCRGTGYNGLTPVLEVMPVGTGAMRQLIQSSVSGDAIADLAKHEGMTTLRQAALGLAAKGETSLAETYKVIFGD